ncbi:MAG TPA: ASCH domain-containing protein [Candidatus Levilactobacillus faecigallinarum]|uniref:ASCH domain-containing protein n=1 Tax=Candidatus Levilactobacillus faecigallinarum TaxID=2838638 RepID=A0A9D1QR02_9LACO|nr:ASCH domain-containing protein [Candidatus Levilactobacillus faecigallinarum]
MTIADYWTHFRAIHPAVTTDTYEAFSLGAEGDVTTANHLVALIKDGIKTATSSARDLYGPDESLPQVGDYGIILDGHHQPVCVVETIAVTTVPFSQVTAEHAYHEGEGSRTLAEWRQVHQAFFQAAYAAMGRPYDADCPCICETYRVIN